MEKIRVKLWQQRGRSMRINRLVKIGGRQHSSWKNRVRFCCVCVCFFLFLIMPSVICGLGLYLLYIILKSQTNTNSIFFSKFKNRKNWKYSDDVFQTENQGKNHIIVSDFLQVAKSHFQLKSIPDLISNFYPLWN
jgi:hypothetical protein